MCSLAKFCITYAAFIWLLSVMKWSNVCSQSTYFCKFGTTYFAFKKPFFQWITAICLLKPCFSANLASHMLHSKGISLSWKAAYVLSNHFFLPIQYHMKCIHKVWQVKLIKEIHIKCEGNTYPLNLRRKDIQWPSRYLRRKYTIFEKEIYIKILRRI